MDAHPNVSCAPEAYRYEVLINLDLGKAFRDAESVATDPYVATYTGVTDPVASFEAAAEWVFFRHQRDDRPDGLMSPSLSAGDAVTLRCGPGDPMTYLYTPNGLVAVDGGSLEVERERKWRDCELRATLPDHFPHSSSS